MEISVSQQEQSYFYGNEDIGIMTTVQLPPWLLLKYYFINRQFA